MSAWSVTSSTVLRPHPSAPGFVEDTAFHGGAVELDPFLALTDFHMTQPTFGPHPHAGFSAVTYMFRDSAGSFRNRDSLGDESTIEPGALHWTQAGAGMMHEEIPIEPGLDCHGLQMFVNLRSDHKMAPPQAFHVSAADVPVVDAAPGARVHVVVGRLGDVASPLEGLLTPIDLFDVDLARGSVVELPVDPSTRVVLLVVTGTVSVDGTTLPVHAVASLRGSTDVLTLHAGDDGAVVLVLAGSPMDEPVVFGGSFCMNSREQIDDAQRRFRAGQMGSLTPSF